VIFDPDRTEIVEGRGELGVGGGGGRMRLLYSVQLVTGTVHWILLIIVQCAACDRDRAPDFVDNCTVCSL
jgi:hypothetical protein